MPFTFAHPLYAFPLKFIRPRYFGIAGLILGSMSPDFEYFIALEPYQSVGHTLKGLFIQAIPLSLAIYILLLTISTIVVQHLSSILHIDVKAYQLISFFNFRDMRKWIVFLVSVVIGFYSHIFVDAFTHQSGYFVVNYPLLQRIYISIPLYKLLQYLLSFVGITVQFGLLIRLFMKLPCSINNFTRIESSRKRIYWFIVVLIALCIVITKLLWTSSTNIWGILVVAPISGFMIGVIVTSLIFKLYARTTASTW